jgi:hypothetical protein
MKLTDISATTGSRAATAKLARQVQKASVAAGKEARTNLGVLGISIGQTQSTGVTSRVNESLSGNEIWELLENLGEAINYRLLRRQEDLGQFNKAEVAEAAVQIMRLYGEGNKKAVNQILYHLSMIRTRAPGAAGGNMEKVLEAKRELDDNGFVPFQDLKTLLDAAATFNAFATSVTGNLALIQEVVDFLENCYVIATANVDHPHRVSFCRAALKHLGILK